MMIVGLSPLIGCSVQNRKIKWSAMIMPVAWHPTRWWNWFISEDKKENRTIFD